MYRRRSVNVQKMAKFPNRYKPPRICIDSLPTNRVFLSPTMSQANMSFASCTCSESDQEELDLCCDSTKYELNLLEQDQNTQTCCEPESDELNASCPMCKPEKEKQQAGVVCSACKAKEDNASNVCSICNEPIDKKADNKCPHCKKNNGKDIKKIEKELRCPSCSQPIALQCCKSDGIPSIHIMLVPEKLLKDSSTNTRNDGSGHDVKCCQGKGRSSSTEGRGSPGKLAVSERDSKSDCGMERCTAMKKANDSPRAPPIKGAESKKKMGSKEDEFAAECADACGPAEKCNCIFPPAYEQYSCTAQISGTCDCTKKA